MQYLSLNCRWSLWSPVCPSMCSLENGFLHYRLQPSTVFQFSCSSFRWPKLFIASSYSSHCFWLSHQLICRLVSDCLCDFFLGTNSCARRGHGCSHLCFSFNKNNYTCGCPTHYSLKKDKKTCEGNSTWRPFANRTDALFWLVTPCSVNHAMQLLFFQRNCRY